MDELLLEWIIFNIVKDLEHAMAIDESMRKNLRIFYLMSVTKNGF